MIRRSVRRFAQLAGGCDALTGLGLVAAPAAVLASMGLPAPAPEVVPWLRWVGAFVFAVGASYWLPFALGDVARRLPVVLEVTALVRGVVALAVLAQVASGALSAGWMVVAIVDSALAVVQVVLLVRGLGDAV